MKKSIIFTVILLLICAVLCSCAGDPNRVSKNDSLIADKKVSYGEKEENYTYSSTDVTSPNSYTAFQKGASEFACQLLKQQHLLNGGNTTVTPANTYVQLALISNAASKSSKQEITDIISPNLNKDSINQCVQYFTTRLNYFSDKEKGSYKTNFGNAFWYNDKFDIKNDFIKTDAKYYGIDLFRLLFSDKSTTTKLRNWIGEYSDEDPPFDIDSQGYMYLTGGITISDNWLENYSASNISAGTFSGTDGESKTDFYAGSEFYIGGENCSGFIKDFKNTPLKMCIILPDEGISMSDFLKNFNGESYLNLISSMNPTKRCTGYLPKFSQTGTEDVTKALQSMGIESIFTDDSNLGGMTNNSDVRVDGVLSSYSLEISEKGISSDKITDSASSANALDNSLEVKVNRPFVFSILDNESNIPIYFGIVESI